MCTKLDQFTQDFHLWSGNYLDAANPQILPAGSAYQLLLPPGTYYLQVTSPGYQSSISSIFTLTSTTAITDKLPLTKAFLFPLPWLYTEFSITPSVSTSSLSSPSPLPDSLLTLTTTDAKTISLRQPTLISFLSPSHPDTASQLKLLSAPRLDTTANIVVIIPHISDISVELMKKRGNYTLDFVADPDGELLEAFQVSSSPTHSLIQNQGQHYSSITGLTQLSDLLSHIE